MLLLFVILTFLCPSSNKILVKEAKISPITQGNVAITFYVVVENVSNFTYSVSTKMTKCCEDISKNEKDCKFMSLIGGEMVTIPSGVTRKVLLLYPNMYSHNRKGQCTIAVRAVSTENKKEMTINTKINFNTYLHHLKSVKGLKKCKSRDLDPYQDCYPVDCTMKYLGTRNFFNSRLKRCQIVSTCLTSPSKQLPDIVYVPRSNICRNLDKCIEAKDIKYLDTRKNDGGKPPKGFTTNVRCHQGILDPDSGFCKCKPGWTSVPMNKDLFEPSLFQFHMCNMRISSWNDVNNKKIKFTLILIAVFGVIVSIFIILFSFLLSIVYRCLNSDQKPVTICCTRTKSTSCIKNTDHTTINTPRTSTASSSKNMDSLKQRSYCTCSAKSSKSVYSVQITQSNPADPCQDKQEEVPSKSNTSTNCKPPVIDKECMPQKKRKWKPKQTEACKDEKKECPSTSESSQKCEDYLQEMKCKNKLTWSKYKRMFKSSSSSPCPSKRKCKKMASKAKKVKCKCRSKKCTHQLQIQEQTTREKCESFIRNLKSRVSISSLLASSCSSLDKESTPICKPPEKKQSKESQKCSTSSEDDNQPTQNTSLYIMNEIKKDQTPTISLESTTKSNPDKQPFHIFHSKQVHHVENQNFADIINKLIENATPKYKSDRHYCSEPPFSMSNTDVSWGWGSSFESRSVTTDLQNNTRNKEVSNGKTSSTSMFGKRPNFHLMEMIEFQISSENEDEDADEEDKSIIEKEPSELKPIVETLNITRPQDFSTSDISNFTPLEGSNGINPSFDSTDESIQQKRPRKLPFLHRHKKYSKIPTSSTSSSQEIGPRNKSKRRKSKSTFKNLQSISSSEDTEDQTKSKRNDKFYGLKTKFRKLLCTHEKEKIPDPTNTSSWTSVKETVSTTSRNKTPNDISTIPSTSHEKNPRNKVEDSDNKESPNRRPKKTNIPIPISSPLAKKSSTTTSPNFSPRSCKIPGPISGKRGVKPPKFSAGPSSRFYVDTDQNI